MGRHPAGCGVGCQMSQLSLLEWSPVTKARKRELLEGIMQILVR
jgi:hypothetical protein